MMLINKLMETVVTSGSGGSTVMFKEEILRPAVRNTELQE